MPNLDYVIVGPGPSVADVFTAVRLCTSSTLAESGALHPLEGRPDARIYVVPDRLVDEGSVVLVYYSSQPVARRHILAATIHEHLATTTNWDVTLDTDAAEDVVTVTSHPAA